MTIDTMSRHRNNYENREHNKDDGVSAHCQTIRATPHRSGSLQEDDSRSMPHSPCTIPTRWRGPEVLRLNVGGSFYTTTKPTFLRHPASLLARIATGHLQVPRDDRHFLVIDRDGNVFRHILNYLRTDRLLLPDGFREVALLREEALYYELPGLVADLDGMLDNRRRQMRRGGNFRRGNNPSNHDSSNAPTRKMSASVGDLHLLQEEDDLDFIEDSWIGGALQ